MCSLIKIQQLSPQQVEIRKWSSLLRKRQKTAETRIFSKSTPQCILTTPRPEEYTEEPLTKLGSKDLNPPCITITATSTSPSGLASSYIYILNQLWGNYYWGEKLKNNSRHDLVSAWNTTDPFQPPRSWSWSSYLNNTCPLHHPGIPPH